MEASCILSLVATVAAVAAVVEGLSSDSLNSDGALGDLGFFYASDTVYVFLSLVVLI
jgi:hypothetical protein